MKRIFVFLIALLLCSCVNEDYIEPPFYITSSYIVLGKEEPIFNFAGAYIDFYNKAEKDIQEITFLFCVYKSDGSPAGIRSNIIESSYTKPIESENTATCIVNLDSCIGPIVDSEYSIDFIRVKKIVYGDGSVWNNYFLLL